MTSTTPDIENIQEKIRNIPDPEIPVITLGELGVIRSVFYEQDGALIVKITPTYSGCPAYNWMEMEIRVVLDHLGIENYRIEEQLFPAWTTEWMDEQAKTKLLAYGIAPPKSKDDKSTTIECPQCRSENTELISEFGSTACKSMYRCLDCLEPFDYFKCH